jgi:hypothetical protein
MSKQTAQSLPRSTACLPLVFGGSAILLSSIYQLQRSGFLGSGSFERWGQDHLDGIGITAFALAGIGMALGLYLGRGGRKSALLLWGTGISVAGALAQLLLPL